jgi:predicted MPP superfamily phosphohydrolase
MFIRFLIVFVLIVVIELYFFQIIKTISIDYSPGKKKIIYYIAYGLAAFSISFGLVALFYQPGDWNNFFRLLYSIAFIIIICKLIGSVFLILDDVVRLFRWIATYFQKAPADATEVTHHISRLKFLSYVGLTFTVVPAISFIYGVVKGAYKYRVHKVKVKSPNLPEAFNGFKIVQLSDIHSGSFLSTEPLITAFNMVLAQKPDMILFTGDLVNNEATEAEPHMESYKMLKAPYGVYSSLGNHDYGDYKQWESKEAKVKNLEDLKDVHAKSGWRLLMNEHVAIEKDGQKIALLGIENWGGNLNFPRYGKLENAHAGTEHYPFKILLSHDPSHWDMQVSQEKQYKDIDLTLSGHTHGMQFGIEIPGFKWSPVQYIYKHWAGLYRQDNQYLYVNRGLGFLGYPGRLGIWPEITVIELERG